MKTLTPIVSLLGLALVIGPPLGYLVGWFEEWLTKDKMTMLMLVGTIVWFVTVPLWMGRKVEQDKEV